MIISALAFHPSRINRQLSKVNHAWAERAKSAGYPERFAQEALGHNSRAVHRAYARKAQVTLPPLEDYEREYERKVVPLNMVSPAAPVPAEPPAAAMA